MYIYTYIWFMHDKMHAQFETTSATYGACTNLLEMFNNFAHPNRTRTNHGACERPRKRKVLFNIM